MTIEISNQIKEVINNMPFNKTVKMNSLKIYAALYLMSVRKNKHGYFAVPSTYLMAINKRYYRTIKYFIEQGIIEPYTRIKMDPNDIFESKKVRYYDTKRGICIKYRFLVPTDGEQIDIDMTTNREFRWYSLIQRSLKMMGFEDIKIKRDTFGRRVHHSAIRDYKIDFKGFYTIDSVASQPRLLYLLLKERGIYDKTYFDIFENDKDFYLELQYKLNLKERDDAKDLFMFWVNSNGYVPDFNIHNVFPVVSKFIKNEKINDYKNIASLLQRKESKIWIDDLLNNVPVDFALPVHDSLIITENDAEEVLQYCINKYPDLKFKKDLIR